PAKSKNSSPREETPLTSAIISLPLRLPPLPMVKNHHRLRWWDPGRKTIRLDDADAVAVPIDQRPPRLLNQSRKPNRSQRQPRSPISSPKYWRNHRSANWPKTTVLTWPQLHPQDNTAKSLVPMCKACLMVPSQLLGRHKPVQWANPIPLRWPGCVRPLHRRSPNHILRHRISRYSGRSMRPAP